MYELPPFVALPHKPEAALLRASIIVLKIHRLRAIQSGLLSPASGAQSWANTRAMTASNPLSAWDIIDFKLLEQREFAREECSSLDDLGG